MSDWISRAVEKKRREEEKQGLKAEKKRQKQLAKEARRKLQEEETKTRMQHWLDHNMVSVTSAYQRIKTHTNRAKDAGFQLSLTQRSNELSVSYGDVGSQKAMRSLNIVPNYYNGFEVTFIIRRLVTQEYGGSSISESKQKWNYPLNRIHEERILSWLEWVATGEQLWWMFFLMLSEFDAAPNKCMQRSARNMVCHDIQCVPRAR